MKNILLFALLLLLSSCGLTPTSAPTATETAPLVAATPTPIPFTPSPEPTMTPEASGIQFERVEANREAIVDYNLDILYDLNRDSAYFKEPEINIKSREDLERVVKENNGLLPSSTSKNPNRIKYLTLKHVSRLEPGSIFIDVPLRVDPTFEIVTPDQKDDKKIYPAFTYPWYFNRSNLDPPPKDKSVSMGIGIHNNGDYNEIVFQLVWNNTDFDFFGNKLSTPATNSVLVGQADMLFRTLMYSGRMLSQSMLDKKWWQKHRSDDGGLMGNNDSLEIVLAYKYLKDDGELTTVTGPTDTIEFPFAIIK